MTVDRLVLIWGFIAQWSGLPESQVVDLHASVLYRVYFVGFTPGFAYLGSVPEKIAAPRLDTPRTRVPSGSVGIAGRQTGIYPADTPGRLAVGWTHRFEIVRREPSSADAVALG